LLSEAEPVMISAYGGSPMYYNPCSIPVAMPVMPAELKSYDPKFTKRVCDGISPAIQCFPAICLPDTQCPSMPVVDMGMGNVGCYTAPCIPNCWERFKACGLNTNMPVL
jgi:hypothetical protein